MYVCMHTRTCNTSLIAKSNQGLRAGNNNNNINKQCDCSRLLSIYLSLSLSQLQFFHRYLRIVLSLQFPRILTHIHMHTALSAFVLLSLV